MNDTLFEEKEIHPDEYSYGIIWDKIISPYLDEYYSVFAPEIEISRYAKERIWDSYSKWNQLCKERYMIDSNGRLDRHKVAACYLAAIETVRPMNFPHIADSDAAHNISNELLAISVAMSVLNACIMSAIAHDKNMDSKEKNQKMAYFTKGIRYPDTEVMHGDYIMNFANEIYFAHEEGYMNILSYAHELFLLEIYTNMKMNEEQDIVKTML